MTNGTGGNGKVTIREVQRDVNQVRNDVEALKQDVAAIKCDIAVVKTDVAGLRLDMTRQLHALAIELKTEFHKSQKETTREIDGMKGTLAVVQVKAGLWGILAGSIPAAIWAITLFWK
jgi:precorrin isomerase